MANLALALSRISPALLSKDAQPITIPFAGWMPDRAALGNPGMIEALNVIPTKDGFGPLADFGTAQSSALTARCQGMFYAIDVNGTVYLFAGDATKLYQLGLGTTTWSDVSKSGGYTTAADGKWEFARFGTSVIMATNFDDAVQSMTIGGTIFADVITSTQKPKARHIAATRDFVVLGNTYDTTDGNRPSRIWWSAISDENDFAPDADTQCDFQDLTKGGWVQALAGNIEYFLVIQETQVSRATYVGSPLVFDIQVISDEHGTPLPGSVISLGRRTWFIDERGFMECDGLTVTPIGHEQVDKEFWDNFDVTYRSLVSAAIDPVRKVVFWSFATTGNVIPNKLFMFNYVERTWANANVTIDIIGSVANQGLSLDDLDTITTDLDALPFSLDSRAWTGGTSRLGAFKTDDKLYHFDSSNLAATLETGEKQLFPGRVAKVKNTRPLTDGGTITVAAAPRFTQQATATFGSAASANSFGENPLMSVGRYHRFRTSIAAAGTWTHAQGIQIEASPQGRA